MEIPRITFGPFAITDSGRVLSRDGEVVPISPKVLAILVVLVQSSGRIVSKTELLDAVWPDSFVEEANLTQNISVLRKLLMTEYPDRSPIETITKVGYRFREPVHVELVDPIFLTNSPEPQPASSVVSIETVPILFEERRAGWMPGWVVQRSRVVLMSVVGLALVTLTASGFLYERMSRARISHPRVAVLAFKNLSNSPETAWLSSALRETLATDLGSDPDIRVVANENVERAELELNLTRTDGLSRETLDRICRNLDCDEVVSGSYLIVGGKVRLDTHLLDAHSGSVLGNYSATMSANDILPLINQTSSVMRSTFGLRPGPPAGRESIQATVSSNPEAYRLYIEGLELSRAWDGRAAAEKLERAIALDPNFPLAHMELSGAYTLLGQQPRAIEEAKKAEALSGSLPREQQLRIKARTEDAERHFEEAAATYASLFSFYPDNVNYASVMAGELSHAGHPQQALDALKPILAQNTPAAHDPRLYSVVSDCHSFMGDWPGALAWATKAADESQRRGAKVLYGRMLTSESQALLYMNQLPLALTKTQEALGIAREFKDFSGEFRALNRIGQIDTAMGKLPEAQAALEEALAHENQLGGSERQIHTLSALGSNLSRQGNQVRAMEVFQRELAAAQTQEPDYITAAELDVARQQVRMGDRQAGRASLRRVVEEAKRLNDKELQKQATEALAEFHEL